MKKQKHSNDLSYCVVNFLCFLLSWLVGCLGLVRIHLALSIIALKNCLYIGYLYKLNRNVKKQDLGIRNYLCPFHIQAHNI